MSAQPLLQVRGLSRRFGGLLAVADLDFDAHAGEVLGVIGPNGAGKSTTFNMIAGALAPSAGTLHFDGAALVGLPTHAFAARGIMRTFQHNKPFPSMTLAENVMIGMHTRINASLWQILAAMPAARSAQKRCERQATEVLEFVGLADWMESDVSTLSFGQGRLLEIARALAGEPRLMLFDEPAAGLSPAECIRLTQIIRAIANRGIAVLLIEHDMRFLMSLAERIVVLNFGRKIAEGTPQDIRSDLAVVEAYLGDLGALARA